MKHKFGKRGQLDQLGGLIAALGYLAILAAIIFLIIAQSKSQVVSIQPCENTSNFWNSTDKTCCTNSTDCTARYGHSAAYNATVRVQSAASDIPSWLPIVVITVIGGVLLTLVRYFKSGQ